MDGHKVRIHRKLVDDFPCFKGETQTSVSAAVLQDIAADAEAALEWSSANVTEGVELARGENYVDYYQYLAMLVSHK